MAEHDIKLVADELPPTNLEVWLYFGPRNTPNPERWRGYYTGTEFKRSTPGTDVTQPNVWGWSYTTVPGAEF